MSGTGRSGSIDARADGADRRGSWARWVVALLASAVVGPALQSAPATAQDAWETPAPEIRFHVGGEELLPIAYPQRYAEGDALREDVDWVDDHSRELRGWWDEEGPTYLRRASDLAGRAWAQDAVEVYLVRYWPVVSIERPLVLALDAIRSSNGVLELPEDDDLRVLILAHQVVHYLLNGPTVVPPDRREGPARHPFLRPGSFELEAMVNWITYEAMLDLWGAERLRRVTSTDLWRGYNPNHAFVTEELMERWPLSRMRTLREWLRAHPEGSEIFEVADRYRREAGVSARAEARTPREDVTGTEHGVDLGATFEGVVIVSYVDEGSPAARAGLRRGDVVLTVEGRDVGDVTDAQRLIDASWERNEEVNLSVRRDGREVFVTLD
ncbi:MAG: PDZ domain-containing protein [Gemmatimonadota bacterium]|nr:PDZ domain-containing protein [Gemmatimonadota bacterium]